MSLASEFCCWKLVIVLLESVIMQPVLTREEKARRRAEREAEIRLKNNKLGITIFQGSWIMVFICLIVVNWQLGYSPGWRPVEKPNMILPIVATVALLISTYFTWMAVQSVKADNIALFHKQWMYATGLGAVFLAIMMQQFFALTPGGDGTQYVYLYRAMIGYHALHALVIGIMMIQVFRYSQHGNYHAGNNWAVEATARLWYFVTIAWVMFFVVLYLI